jgi:hypothetical protein
MTTRTRLAALALAFAGVASLVGASSGAPPAAARAGGRLERDGMRGDFWRPEVSVASRPVLQLTPPAWQPRSSASD